MGIKKRHIMNKQEYAHINTDYIFELADGDPDFLKDIISDVMKTVPANIAQLDDAIVSGNMNDINFLAHKLKGTFLFIGNAMLGDMLNEIERGGQSLEEISLKMETIKKEYALAEAEFQSLLNNI